MISALNWADIAKWWKALPVTPQKKGGGGHEGPIIHLLNTIIDDEYPSDEDDEILEDFLSNIWEEMIDSKPKEKVFCVWNKEGVKHVLYQEDDETPEYSKEV